MLVPCIFAGVKKTICNIASISSENHNSNSCPGLIGLTHCNSSDDSKMELVGVDCFGEGNNRSCTL